ncbi:MAG: hypothetical protein MUF04_13100, partial [Akkermansiaceae bacterium]|nr:hypothetical protein [Akkermansiaceae bacterium]
MAVGGWLVFSLPLPAASPILEINRPSPNAVRLAWPAAERNWVVEGGTDLARMVTVLSAPRIEGDRIALTLPATEPAFFWRLRSQVTAGAAGGRNFLRDSQNDAGQWGVAGQASVLYSAGALEALHQLGWADPSFDGVVGFGLDALGYAVTRNNDELSRKIIALATGGRPVTSLVDELLGAQNPELPEATSLAYPGLAWGAAPALGGTVIDTALALRALEAARALGAGLGLSVVREAVPAGATSAG